MSTTKVSQNGLSYIRGFEGYSGTAYWDSTGKVWTIGYGTTVYPSGKAVKSGDKCTKAEAESYFANDVSKFSKHVLKYADKYDGWNQNELDALTSFAYNIGNIKQLTADGTRSRAVIADKMLEYNKSGGQVLNGLTKRRKEERELFLKKVSGSTANTTEKPATSTPAATGTTYTVVKGDTLGAIAKKYGTTAKAIVNANKSTYKNITVNYIQAGWKLKIVNSTKTTTATNYKKGDKIKLNKASLYASSSASKAAGIKTGTFYLLDGKAVNNRYRITTESNHVGNVAQTTGWVKKSDIKY